LKVPRRPESFPAIHAIIDCLTEYSFEQWWGGRQAGETVERSLHKHVEPHVVGQRISGETKG
jgi:hypothetical protein